jgi:hypothetical protein
LTLTLTFLVDGDVDVDEGSWAGLGQDIADTSREDSDDRCQP